MDKKQLIELLSTLIDANQSDVNNADDDPYGVQWSEEDLAFYRGKISAYNTILEVLVEGK